MGDIVDDILDPVESVFGGPSFGDSISALTGQTGAAASLAAAELQAQQAREALELQKSTLNRQFGLQKPFFFAGSDVAPTLAEETFSGVAPVLDTDPSRVINNPLFQALARDQERSILASQAARGKLGSGETQDDLIRNVLLLGTQFQDRDINQQQQNFQNLLASQQQRFGQLFDISRLGANVVAGAGTTAQRGAESQGNILGQLGNALSAGQIGAAQAQAQGAQNLAGLGSLIASFFCDRRLKENVNVSDELPNGLKLYNFNYTELAQEKFGLTSERVYDMPMADEVEALFPEAISIVDGFKVIDMDKVEQWRTH